MFYTVPFASLLSKASSLCSADVARSSNNFTPAASILDNFQIETKSDGLEINANKATESLSIYQNILNLCNY